MRNKSVATILFLSLFASILTIAISPVAAVNENVGLYIDPDPVEKAPGDVCSYFNVSVMIENVTDLFGFDLNITWDNTLITFSRCYYNDTLDALWGSGNWFLVKSETGGGGGGGWYKFVALSTASGFTKDPGNQPLFRLEFHVVKACNFPLETLIHFEVVKLSDSNWQPITAVTTDGLYKMSATVPDLEFVLFDPNPSKPFEYCKIFEVGVWVTHICAGLKDYDFTILYDSELLKFVDVDYWGVLGDLSDNAHVDGTTPGRIHVWDTGGIVWSGDRGLLFNLTFHIEFDDRIEHIWRTLYPKELTAHVSFENAELSFEEGTIPMSGIAMPSPLNIIIGLIRGDVTCDGKVDVFDLRTVAAYYDQSAPVKYDLTCDGTIDIFDLVVIATNYGYEDP